MEWKISGEIRHGLGVPSPAQVGDVRTTVALGQLGHLVQVTVRVKLHLLQVDVQQAPAACHCRGYRQKTKGVPSFQLCYERVDPKIFLNRTNCPKGTVKEKR